MTTPPQDLNVWILAGQSNMQGCGPLVGALKADAGVWNLTTAGHWEPAVEPLHRLWESYAPVHQNFMRPHLSAEDALLTNAQIADREANTRKDGAGLGIAFANLYQNGTGRPVGLVSAAHGGTSLQDWNHNRKGEGLDSLYGAMLDRARRAGGNLRGILWYQGESDANPDAAASYADRFDAWVDAARADLGHPDLPIIVTQLSRYVLGEDSEGPASTWNQLREAQRTLPSRRHKTAVAPAIDLSLSDSIHVGTPGLIRLGQRMARLALAMEGGTPHLGPRVSAAKVTPGHFDINFVRLECSGVAGGWNPHNYMAGFSMHTEDGAFHPFLKVVDASRDGTDPTAINLLLTGPVDQNTAVAYGQGMNPYCNVVDNLDMALPTFGPIRVELCNSAH